MDDNDSLKPWTLSREKMREIRACVEADAAEGLEKLREPERKRQAREEERRAELRRQAKELLGDGKE